MAIATGASTAGAPCQVLQVQLELNRLVNLSPELLLPRPLARPLRDLELDQELVIRLELFIDFQLQVRVNPRFLFHYLVGNHHLLAFRPLLRRPHERRTVASNPGWPTHLVYPNLFRLEILLGFGGGPFVP